MGLMDNFKQLGDMKKLMDLQKQLQKKLEEVKITVEHKGVVVEVTADLKVQSISGESDFNKVTEAVNEAIKQAQKVAAEETQSLMKSMGVSLPGM